MDLAVESDPSNAEAFHTLASYWLSKDDKQVMDVWKSKSQQYSVKNCLALLNAKSIKFTVITADDAKQFFSWLDALVNNASVL